jgi:hypothetical protein
MLPRRAQDTPQAYLLTVHHTSLSTVIQIFTVNAITLTLLVSNPGPFVSHHCLVPLSCEASHIGICPICLTFTSSVEWDSDNPQKYPDSSARDRNVYGKIETETKVDQLCHNIVSLHFILLPIFANFWCYNLCCLFVLLTCAAILWC